jgi:hypothetical protein
MTEPDRLGVGSASFRGSQPAGPIALKRSPFEGTAPGTVTEGFIVRGTQEVVPMTLGREASFVQPHRDGSVALAVLLSGRFYRAGRFRVEVDPHTHRLQLLYVPICPDPRVPVVHRRVMYVELEARKSRVVRIDTPADPKPKQRPGIVAADRDIGRLQSNRRQPDMHKILVECAGHARCRR